MLTTKKHTYAELGSELDHATAETQMSFHRAFDRHADPALAALADYAFWRASAQTDRLAGNVAWALAAEAKAEAVYQLDIDPANRW